MENIQFQLGALPHNKTLTILQSEANFNRLEFIERVSQNFFSFDLDGRKFSSYTEKTLVYITTMFMFTFTLGIGYKYI